MRTIKGVICNYGVLGYPSTGPTIFAAHSINVPSDPRRVKFLEQHDTERPLGVMASHGATSNGDPEAEFTIAETPAGDEALAMVQDGRRDGLSVGVRIDAYHWNEKEQLVITACSLQEVSLVTIPAYSDSLATASNAPKGTDMTGKTLNLTGVKLTASAANTEQPATTEPPVEATAGNHTPATPAPPVAPAAPITPQATASQGVNLGTLSASIAGHFAVGNSAATLNAALTDVLLTDDDPKGAIVQPQWLGELWQARRVERPTVEALTRKPLTGLKAKGYVRERASTTKLMNPYDGNKTETPASGKMKTRVVEETAKRYFGGWDVDRAIIDFGDEELIRINLEAAYDDYLEQTEADAVTTMLGAATTIAAQEDILAVLRELGIEAARLGSNLTKIQMGGDLWAQFATLTTAEVPWWLQRQGELNLGTTSGNAGALSFSFSPDLDDNEFLAHDKRAATFFETPQIKVQAQDISRGGVDLGVFGYAYTMVNDARAIFTGSLTGGDTGTGGEG